MKYGFLLVALALTPATFAGELLKWERPAPRACLSVLQGDLPNDSGRLGSMLFEQLTDAATIDRWISILNFEPEFQSAAQMVESLMGIRSSSDWSSSMSLGPTLSPFQRRELFGSMAQWVRYGIEHSAILKMRSVQYQMLWNNGYDSTAILTRDRRGQSAAVIYARGEPGAPFQLSTGEVEPAIDPKGRLFYWDPRPVRVEFYMPQNPVTIHRHVIVFYSGTKTRVFDEVLRGPRPLAWQFKAQLQNEIAQGAHNVQSDSESVLVLSAFQRFLEIIKNRRGTNQAFADRERRGLVERLQRFRVSESTSFWDELGKSRAEIQSGMNQPSAELTDTSKVIPFPGLQRNGSVN